MKTDSWVTGKQRDKQTTRQTDIDRGRQSDKGDTEIQTAKQIRTNRQKTVKQTDRIKTNR